MIFFKFLVLQYMDKNKDGFITRDEMKMIFAALPERLSQEEIEEMLDAADDDGRVNLW